MTVFPALASWSVMRYRREQSLTQALIVANREKDEAIVAIVKAVEEHESERISAAALYWMDADEHADKRYARVH